ncbi:MAG TPA: PEP-utilizing enzyme [Methanobacterium sp.]|nr:PEP-utilizing enzyme [Methanobacterium sp.]
MIIRGIGTNPYIGVGKVKMIETLHDLINLDGGEIVVVSKASRDMLSYLRKAGGVITDYGGITSHVAIVLREFGVPCVVGTGDATLVLKENEIVTVDAKTGNIYQGFIELEEEKEFLEVYNPSTRIKANLNIPEIAGRVAPYADGVGSLRIENMIIRTGKHPQILLDEDRLTDVLTDGVRVIVDAFYPKSVFFRTFDIPTDELKHLEGGEIEPAESNPLLGSRGIKKDLNNPQILEAQFMAVKNLLDEGYSNLALKIPYVRDISEYIASKKYLKKCGIIPHQDLKVGVSVETPSVVFTFDEFLKSGLDFITIGMSDLTMCNLAVDRRGVKVAKHFQITHPSVMAMVKMVIDQCIQADVESCITCYAASDPRIVRQMVHWGISSISTNPDQILKMRRIVDNAENELILRNFHS